MPFIVVTIPLPHTCIGPLELGPRNIVIGVPLTVVGIPEPQTGLATGELLDGTAELVVFSAAVLVHAHGVSTGCVDIMLILETVLLLPARNDEMMPGTARTPEAVEVDTAALEVVFVGGQGHIHVELVAGGGAVTTRTLGAGCAEGVMTAEVELACWH